ncbi:NFAT activation molecule 1 isoform X2 [Protopterus annectens]|uniref:NFAT activation molecule 1 isoform X2 n=1 Tax=Protopterus annectens TaxID=7888 RepID=UPI001CFAB5DF|nr:NFAT activation molecule 1 isoform X2 [Protopterus annectens]
MTINRGNVVLICSFLWILAGQEKGFQEPPPFMGFRYALVSVCVCLGIFSIVGTAFLFWRGNVYSYMRCCKKEKDEIKDKSTTSTTTATATKTDKADGAGSFYMSLNPQEAGIYNVIEQETHDLKKKKITDGQTVHPQKDAHSRNDSSKPGGSTMEKKKIQVKLKPGKKNQEEVFESVYENL